MTNRAISTSHHALNWGKRATYEGPFVGTGTIGQDAEFKEKVSDLI